MTGFWCFGDSLGTPWATLLEAGGDFWGDQKKGRKKERDLGSFSAPGGTKLGTARGQRESMRGLANELALVEWSHTPCAHSAALRWAGGLIVSASRSPPGLCSNLRSSVRVPNEYTFRVTFRIIFGPFGIIFEACLGPWGHFGGAVGSLFASKISLGLQRWPKKRLPRNPLTLLETFWSSFFEYFRCFC